MPLEAYFHIMPLKAYIDFMHYKAYLASAMALTIQTPAQLSAHLRSLRKSRGMTQAQLATLVGVDQTRIAKIEREPSHISVAQLFRILTALGVQVQLQLRTKTSAHRGAAVSSEW